MPTTALPKDHAKFHAWFSNFMKKFNGKNNTSLSPAQRKALQQAWKNWQKWYREWNQASKRYHTLSQKLNQYRSQGERIIRFHSSRTGNGKKTPFPRPQSSTTPYRAWLRTSGTPGGQWQIWIGWTSKGKPVPVWEFPTWGKSAIIQVKVGNGRWQTLYQGKKFPYKFNLNARNGAKVQFRGAIFYGSNKRTPWAEPPAFTYPMAA